MDPIFTAVSTNANHLYTLLRCIGFAQKAAVQITPDGIRFSAEEGRVMQGLAFLDKALFANYTFRPPRASDHGGDDGGNRGNNDDDDDEDVIYPHFLISLSALLETLQIFGISDHSSAAERSGPPSSTAASAFTAPAVLQGRSCTLRYSHLGGPLSIILSEAGVTATCELTTYDPSDPSFGSSDGEVDIPLQRDAIVMKIIMRSALLHNAITELDSTDPTVLTISASATKPPFFALSGSGGPFSESTVEFSVEGKTAPEGSGDNIGTRRPNAKLAPTVTETFQVNPPSYRGGRVKERYRFSLIRKASRAMAVASKVSIRGDVQGVLSLQFMIELNDGGSGGASGGATGSVSSRAGMGNVSFVDFRFVPLVDEDGEEDGHDPL